jgi:hypothetical protein
MKTHRILSILASLVLISSATAQVPPLINYQGRVIIGSSNYSGTGQFKFALVNSNGTVSFWSNNGTSVGGSEPSASVGIFVTNGLYSVLLGDASLANMTPVAGGAFTNADVRLRVWFNGGSGSQLLTPDQRIVSVGYALMSSNVVDGAITSNKLATGSVTSSKIADGSVTGVKLAPGAVTSATLGDSLTLGNTTNANGTLTLYRTSVDSAAITLSGSGNSITTFGDDGFIQTRLLGPTFGQLELFNSHPNNYQAVDLSANGTSGAFLQLNNSNGIQKAYLSGLNAGGALSLYQGNGNAGIVANAQGSGGYMYVYQADGQVGVQMDGDSSGAGYVSVRGTNGSVRGSLDGSDGGGGALRLSESDGTETATLTSQGNGNLYLRQGDGGLGVGVYANNGSGGGGVSIYDTDATFAAQLTVGDTTRKDGYLGLASGSGSTRVYARVWNGVTASGVIGLRNASDVQTITLDADASGDGRITTQVLQITGGSDLSENFDIRSIHKPLEPGMIVCIDPENPGRLITSGKAYDTTVAGVVSGAGGVKTGMLMGQKGSEADGQHPVALTGRVYCLVDADKAPVRPGDLLTSSDTPGHGMKVTDHTRSQGAIIGKAMTALEKGKGLVLVLVTLQ